MQIYELLGISTEEFKKAQNASIARGSLRPEDVETQEDREEFVKHLRRLRFPTGAHHPLRLSQKSYYRLIDAELKARYTYDSIALSNGDRVYWKERPGKPPRLAYVDPAFGFERDDFMPLVKYPQDLLEKVRLGKDDLQTTLLMIESYSAFGVLKQDYLCWTQGTPTYAIKAIICDSIRDIEFGWKTATTFQYLFQYSAERQKEIDARTAQ